MKTLPLGIQTFAKIVENDRLYVDKTKYVYELTHTYDYVFLSRPRRFGKSLLCDTFKMYFEGRKDMFQGLAIMDLEKDWRQYPVIHLDLSIREENIDSLKTSLNSRLNRVGRKWGLSWDDKATYETKMADLIDTAYNQTGQRVVVIIDEYDAALLNAVDDPKFFKEVRGTLNSLFSPLKSLDSYIKFLFITGISKFSQVSIFSSLNNLFDVSLDPKYEGVCGFTKEELRRDFPEYVQMIADKYNCDLESAYEELRKNYDGYHFSEEMTCDVFNPFSILNSFAKRNLNSYWFDSASPSALIKLVDKLEIDFEELENCDVKLESFSVPIESIDDPIPLLFQSGYLTIKDYDRDVNSYTLSYPNKEVRVALAKQLLRYKTNNPPKINNFSKSYDAFWKSDDLDRFLLSFKAFLKGFPFSLDNSDKNEKHYHGLLYTALVSFGADVFAEKEQYEGKPDIILKMPKTIYILELKYGKSVGTALSQAKKKDYAGEFADDKRPVKVIGINFLEEEVENEIFKYKVKMVRE